MTRSGSSSSAPMAMPITWWPRTTSTDRPPAVASTLMRSGWRPAATLARASNRASRTSPSRCLGRPSITRSNWMGPSVEEWYPSDASCSSHKGGIRPAGLPSTTMSTPSTVRPAARPGVRSRARSARRSARSVEILMAFALRGAPCGYRAHPTVAVRACHAQQTPMLASADHRESVLFDRVAVVAPGEPARIPLDRHRLGESDPVLAQVGLRLLGIPWIAHPGDRSDGRSPGPQLGLTRGLTGNLSQRAQMIGRE